MRREEIFFSTLKSMTRKVVLCGISMNEMSKKTQLNFSDQNLILEREMEN